MKKERFINEEILLRNLPAFPHFPAACKTQAQKEEHLDKLIDGIEEMLILEKAEEIKKKRGSNKPILVNTQAVEELKNLRAALDQIVAESHSWVMEQETAHIKKPIYDKFRAIAKKALE